MFNPIKKTHFIDRQINFEKYFHLNNYFSYKPKASMYFGLLKKRFVLAVFVLLFNFGSVRGQINYSFNFDANATGWTGDFARFTTSTACGGSGGSMRRNLYSTQTTGQLISPLVGTSNGMSATVSYSYKAALWSANTAAVSNWGTFDVQYGATATGPWTTFATITNETQLGNACISKSHNVTLPVGNIFIRFRPTWQSDDYYLNFDNITVTQAAATSCSGTPSSGTATISSSSGCSGVNFTVSAADLTAGTGITYQWQSSSSSTGPWSNISGATSTSLSTSATSTTYYQLVTTCSNSGQSNTTNVVSYSVINCLNVPFTGNNSVSCGTNTTLYDHGGSSGNYSNDANGYTVLNNAGTAVITLSGNSSGESCCDYVRVYRGVGLGGTLVNTYYMNTAIPTITSLAGEALTVQFYSDYSTRGSGFTINVSYSGSCVLPPCSGTPNTGTASISSASGCSGVNFTLSATDLTAGTGITYQWQSSSTSIGPWSNIAGANSSSLITSASSTTFYQLVTTCSNGGQSNTTNVVSYSVINCLNVPFTGNNSVSCGTNTTLYDHGGSSGNYSNDANGYTVLNNAGTAVITLSGTSSGESCCDYVRVYRGVGLGGTLVNTYYMNTAIPTITSLAGEALTVQFYSDYSTTGSGFTINVSYSGSCVLPPCSGIPNAGVAAISSSSGCSGVNFTLSATDLTAGTGITYQWQSSSSSSGPWSNIAGATSTSLSTSATSTTYYQLVTTCSNSGQSNTTNVVSYSISCNSPSNDACANSTNLPCATYNLSGTTINSISETPPGGCSNVNNYGVWYTFVGDGQPSTILVDGGSFDVGMAIYSGNCNSLSFIACHDDYPANSASEMHALTTVYGQNYYVYVSHYDNISSITGNFLISRICQPSCATNNPAGNTCALAEPICDFNGYCGNTSSSYTVDTWIELTDAFNLYGNGASIENNSFLSFTAGSSTVNLEIFVSNCSDGYGIQMMIFSGTCGSGPVTTYEVWSPGTVTDGIITINGLTPGNTYYLMIDGYAGDNCDYIMGASSSSGVIVPVDASDNVAICVGGSTQLSATGGNGTYTWTPSTGLSSASGSNVTATPSQTTTYTVSSSTGNPLCPVNTENQVTVTVNPYPTANITATTLCAGAGNTATLTATGGGTYLWSPGNQTTNAITISSAGSYSVQVTANGCTSSADATINVSIPPSIISISPP
jgi:hypothetical protein